MHDLAALGPADVDDPTLAAMVASLLGADGDTVTLVDSKAEEFPYDLPAITTAGRYVVSGTARSPASARRTSCSSRWCSRGHARRSSSTCPTR